MGPVPKLNGADIELGNFVLGLDRRDTTCREALSIATNCKDFSISFSLTSPLGV